MGGVIESRNIRYESTEALYKKVCMSVQNPRATLSKRDLYLENRIRAELRRRNIVTPKRKYRSTIPAKLIGKYIWNLHAAGESYAEMARRCGYVSPDDKPHVSRLKRLVGLAPWQDGRGYRGRKKFITIDAASHICRSLDIDPWEIGL